MNYGAAEDQRAGRIAIGIVLAIAVIGGGWWLWQRSRQAAPVTDAVVAEPEAPPAEEPAGPPPIQHPLEPEAPAADSGAAVLPTDPDEAAKTALTDLFGADFAGWLVTDQLARRLVATVDNLPRNSRIEPLRPLHAPAGPFVVDREVIDATVNEERITLAEANFARYDRLVALLSSVDAAQAASMYRRIYPQLQAAYQDLGYPSGYFNDRVVSVIDHLLATPEPEGPLLLEQPKVMYRFADPDLEALSPGQKLLLRIGPAHARTVKQKLAQIRAQITTPATNTNKE
jgi:hypothetical protein